MSLRFTVVDVHAVASTPAFLGSNPAEVPSGPAKGLRVLAAEEDMARALLLALDGPRRARAAIISAVAPNDILALNARAVSPTAPAGIAAAGMDDLQRGMLMRLIDVYASTMASDIAAESDGQAASSRRRSDRIRVGRPDGARGEALLPNPGADLPGRV